LLNLEPVFSGLKRDGYVFINTSKSLSAIGIDNFLKGWRRDRIYTIPANEISLRYVGRLAPNVPLLGGFAAVSGLIQLESVAKAINKKFSGKVAEGNIAAAHEAYESVKTEIKPAEVCPA